MPRNTSPDRRPGTKMIIPHSAKKTTSARTHRTPSCVRAHIRREPTILSAAAAWPQPDHNRPRSDDHQHAAIRLSVSAFRLCHNDASVSAQQETAASPASGSCASPGGGKHQQPLLPARWQLVACDRPAPPVNAHGPPPSNTAAQAGQRDHSYRMTGAVISILAPARRRRASALLRAQPHFANRTEVWCHRRIS